MKTLEQPRLSAFRSVRSSKVKRSGLLDKHNDTLLSPPGHEASAVSQHGESLFNLPSSPTNPYINNNQNNNNINNNFIHRRNFSSGVAIRLKSLDALKLNQRVMVDGYGTGVVRFLGCVHFAQGLFVGVELDEPNGTSDGYLRGKRYFTAKDKHGYLAKQNKVHPIFDDNLLLDDMETNSSTTSTNNSNINTPTSTKSITFKNRDSLNSLNSLYSNNSNRSSIKSLRFNINNKEDLLLLDELSLTSSVSLNDKLSSLNDTISQLTKEKLRLQTENKMLNSDIISSLQLEQSNKVTLDKLNSQILILETVNKKLKETNEQEKILELESQLSDSYEELLDLDKELNDETRKLNELKQTINNNNNECNKFEYLTYYGSNEKDEIIDLYHKDIIKLKNTLNNWNNKLKQAKSKLLENWIFDINNNNNNNNNINRRHRHKSIKRGEINPNINNNLENNPFIE